MFDRCFKNQTFPDSTPIYLNYRLIGGANFGGINAYDDSIYKNWDILNLNEFPNPTQKLAYLWEPQLTAQDGAAIIQDKKDRLLTIVGYGGVSVGLAMMIYPGDPYGSLSDQEIFFGNFVGTPFSMALFPEPITVTAGDTITVNYEMVW